MASNYDSFKYHESMYSALTSANRLEMGAVVRSIVASTSDVNAEVTPVPRLLVRDRFEIQYVPSPVKYSSYADIIAFVRVTFPGDPSDVGGYIIPSPPAYIYGIIRVMQFKDLPGRIIPTYTSDLNASIYSIPGVDLYGHITPYWVKEITALLSPVPPVNLQSFIRTQISETKDLDALIYSSGGWLNLDGQIHPYSFKDLETTIRSWDIKNLDTLIRILEKGESNDLSGLINIILRKDIKGIINGVLDTNNYENVTGFIRIQSNQQADFSGSIQTFTKSNEDISGVIGAIEPHFLYGTIGLKFPSTLYGSIRASDPKRVIDRFELQYGPAKDLSGLVNPSGGFLPLLATLNLVSSSNQDFQATIQCYDVLSLEGVIHFGYYSDISSTLSTRSIKDSLREIEGKLKVIYSDDLSGIISTNENKLDLSGVVSTKGASKTITAKLLVDKTFYSDVIFLNTKMSSELNALIISTSACHFSSGFSPLSSFIRTFNYSKSDIVGPKVPITYNTTDSHTNGYSGEIKLRGNYTGIDPISYQITIDTTIGDSIGNGVRFSVTSTNNVDDNSYVTISNKETYYPVGTKGIEVAFMTDEFSFVDGDYWTLDVSAPPGLLEATIAFRPFIEYFYADISYGSSFQETTDMSGLISAKGYFSNLQAYIETNAKLLTATIRSVQSDQSQIDATLKVYEWNVFLNASVGVTLLIPKIVPYKDSFQYITNSIPKTIKDVKVSFSGKGKEYIYSSLLSNTYLVDGDVWGVELDLFEEQTQVESGNFGSLKKIKKKVMMDISDFQSFDEAMRYFADFIAYGLTSSIDAYVVPHGGFKSLNAVLTIQDINKLKDVKGRIVVSDPTKDMVEGLVQVVGGFSTIPFSIKGVAHSNSLVEANIYSENYGTLQATIEVIS